MASTDPRTYFWLAYLNGPYDRFVTILGVFSDEKAARRACSRAKLSKEYRADYHQVGIRMVMLDVHGDSQII